MALPETEQLTRMIAGAALSRAICTIGELGVADHIVNGTAQPVAHLAKGVRAAAVRLCVIEGRPDR